MAGKENLGCDSGSNHSIPTLPLLRVKQEPIDEYEQGTDVDIRIAQLNKHLTECEQRARQAEEDLEQAIEREMEWIVKSAESERERVSAEQQLQQLQKEQKKAARAAEAQRAESEKIQTELREKFESALASSVEGAKLVEAASIEKRRLEDELEKSKSALASSSESVKLMEAVMIEKSRLEDGLEKSKSALASSSESAKLMETVKIEKRRLEEELEKSKANLEKERNEWNGKLEESEKKRAKLEELLKNEKREAEKERERSRESRETKKRQIELTRENEDLQDRLTKLSDRLERHKNDAEGSNRLKEEWKKGAEMKIERLEKIRSELTLETKKRQVELTRENEDLQDRLTKLSDRLERHKQDAERSDRLKEEWKKGAEMKIERLERMRSELIGKLEESEKRRAKLEELLKKENKENERERERSSENRETKKRQAEVTRKNEDLQDRLTKLSDRLERHMLDTEGSNRLKEEWQKGAEMKIERLERMRSELSKSLEEASRLQAGMEKERDGLREKWREAEENQLDLSNVIVTLRTRCDQLEQTNEEMRQKLIEEEEKERQRSERWREIAKERRRIQAEAEKERAKFAEMDEEMEQLRKVNTLLVTTRTGELYVEVMEARGRIRQLEEEVRAMNVTGSIKMEGEEELKRKRAKKEEPKEEEEGDFKDKFVAYSDSDGSADSTPPREKVTVASVVADKIPHKLDVDQILRV